MAKRKKNKQKGKGNGKGQQTESFKQFMLGQTLKKFKGYIDTEISAQAQQLANQQKNLLENLYIRVRVLEELALEKFDDITKDVMANRIATIEDQAAGLEQVDVVKKGDRVRMTIATKAKDQEEYQGTSKMMIDRTGTGQTLGNELEGALLGMKTCEEKELDFGKDKTMVAKLKIDRVSRDLKAEAEAAEKAKQIKKQAKELIAEDKASTAETPENKKETSNVDSNEG